MRASSVRAWGRLEGAFTPQHNTFRINSLREAVQRDELLPLTQIVRTDAGEVISNSIRLDLLGRKMRGFEFAVEE